MWKAICTDIDGTLLNAERRLSERTIKAFQKIKDDVPIILASSRMPAAMRHLQQEIGITTQPLICYNGGYIIDQDDKIEVLSSTEIQYEWLHRIIQTTQILSLHTSIYAEDSWFAPESDFWTAREENNTKVKATILANQQLVDMWSEKKLGAHKIMLMGDSDKIDHVVNELEDQNAPLHLYRSKDTYLEIAPKQISKASALSLLVERKLNIDLKEIMAFGDNFNDIELLKAVGNGVAVANAKEELKSVANEVTDLAKEDGVAKTIEKYYF
ncbi:fructose-phosphate phosphohydrolase SppA [Marivirga atlantica]|jgi:Cof subfamily protein (haloacid dehalogenase superfamily)|uniref:HAD family phosphatase n=1 Tax=Marivirga atlantica TaxID=1548457 RepID=A0A937DIM8_9BACT|nr:Cof-type HAD-IIB family hydrolase [Marivirga atlantica]MBL0764346.1 HAD family phosphatase [Marivirga atlantica]